MIPNNFKEIRIIPNEDGTFKIEYYGVPCKDANGQEFELEKVTYLKVRIKPLSLSTFNKTQFEIKQQFEIEVFPDFEGKLIETYMAEKE